MLTLGPIAFALPWALASLLALPLLWWLLRFAPPAPVHILFPPIRLLFGLNEREETAARTPWWLLVLRLVLIIAVIFAAAKPLLHPRPGAAGAGPLVIVVDDGWAAARNWSSIQQTMSQLIGAAQRNGRAVVLATTALGPQPTPPPAPGSAAQARTTAEALRPKPWPTDRAAAVAALADAAATGGWPAGEVVWLADGVAEPAAPGRTDTNAEANQTLARLTGRLAPLGPLAVYRPPPEELPAVLSRSPDGQSPLDVTLRRPAAGPSIALGLRLVADDGQVLAREPVTFAENGTSVQTKPVLPTEWLNQVARIDIEGEATAASVLLADDGWKRRPVGLVTQLPAGGERPLIGTFFYVDEALTPVAEVRRGPLADLLHRDLAVLVLADTGTLDPASEASVRAWVEAGGVLLRFAGPSLLKAASRPDPLLPVVLRPSDRALGGALSWGATGRLAPFPETGPLAGLTAPTDVEIRRQVLAEPGLDLSSRTWASLEDGTPLITGARSGQGWVVLVHTTANAEWSNLPLSGVFVHVLQRIVDLGRGTPIAIADGPPLRPLATIDGFGVLAAPPVGAAAITAADWPTARPGPGHPPGYYGNENGRRALNLSAGLAPVHALGPFLAGVAERGYAAGDERDLRPWLWGIALLLALVDLAASLVMRGLIRLRPAVPAAVVAITLAGGDVTAAVAAPTVAREEVVAADGSAPPAALSTRLAYVRTGDANVDAISEAGLTGLSGVLNRRTATDLGPPVGVDPANDELVFYPLIYWPLTSTGAVASPAAARRIAAYLRTGGTILFDTRGAAGGDLGALAKQLDLPPLVPVGNDHVLKRAYYLLDDLPGRWSGRPLWVEPASETVNDGVSSVIAGSADWAGAWAVDSNRRPLLPVVPGGERQREMAYRFGVNLVIYVLTGNYKADQVHLPTILERLSQ
ncbi:MAG: DUF4159 domain-containing protein [Rhodospirillales bacterium]